MLALLNKYVQNIQKHWAWAGVLIIFTAISLQCHLYDQGVTSGLLQSIILIHLTFMTTAMSLTSAVFLSRTWALVNSSIGNKWSRGARSGIQRGGWPWREVYNQSRTQVTQEDPYFQASALFYLWMNGRERLIGAYASNHDRYHLHTTTFST